MANRVDTVGATQLQPGTPIVKRNYNTAITVGGASGQVVGAYLGAFIKLPSTFGLATAQMAIMFGADADRDGVYNETGDSALVIGGQTSSTAQLRPRWRWSTLFIGSDNMTQMALSGRYFVLFGPATNRGTNASPLWIAWIAYCDMATGTVHSWTQAHNSTLTASTTQGILDTVFGSAGTASNRTPANTEIEQVFHVDGDFPWDTANDGSVTGSVAGQGRPHHDAIRALAGFGTDPFLDIAGMVAGANAGTLPYANLRTEGGAQGRGVVTDWVKLTTAADLTNAGSNSSNAFAVTLYNGASVSGLSGTTSIAPSHWAPAGTAVPVITTPLLRFHGGRGARVLTIAGTYDAVNTTALQFRLTYEASAVNAGAATGAVVPGFDWSSTGFTLTSGNFSLAFTPPVGGRYQLEIRDANDTAVQAVPLGGLVVGTIVTLWGQSGAALGLLNPFTNSPLGGNYQSAAVDSTAMGYVMRLQDIDAGGSGAYAQPTPVSATLLPGTTPTVGHGVVRAVNSWNAINPREPLGIIIPAINGTAMVDWNANNLVLGSASWRFMGSKVAPGVSSAGSSGVVGYHALLMDSYTDLHAMMWTGIGDLQSDRTTWTGLVDGFFSNAATAPYLLFPPWRGRRDPVDSAANITTRNNAIAYVDELNAVTPGRGNIGGYWPDIVSDGTGIGANGSLHSAKNTSTGSPDASNPVSDANSVGQGKIGRRFGRSVAEYFNRKVKAETLFIVGAWYTNGSFNSITVQLPRAMRTLNGKIMANRFSFSLNNGVSWGTWGQAGNGDTTAVTATLSADGRTVTLVRASGTWSGSVRVDYCRDWPFGPSDTQATGNTPANADVAEEDAELALQSLLYDNLTYAGNTDLGGGAAGNVLASQNKVGSGIAGVAVATSAGSATLVTTKKFTGARAPVLEMYLLADGSTVTSKAANFVAS